MGNTDTLASGAMLYLDGQPVTSNEVVAAAAADLEILQPDGGMHLQVASLESKIYRRTENPENQNFYITEGDTGVNAEKSYCSTRGSSNIYPCEAKDYPTATTAKTDGTSPMFTQTDQSITAGVGVWVAAIGHFQYDAYDATGFTVQLNNIYPANEPSDFFS